MLPPYTFNMNHLTCSMNCTSPSGISAERQLLNYTHIHHICPVCCILSMLPDDTVIYTFIYIKQPQVNFQSLQCCWPWSIFNLAATSSTTTPHTSTSDATPTTTPTAHHCNKRSKYYVKSLLRRAAKTGQ